MKILTANDLMVGDIVSLSDRYGNAIAEVCEVRGETVRMTNGYGFGYADIVPVPVTDEVLEKSGFHYGYVSRDKYKMGTEEFANFESGWCLDVSSGEVSIKFPSHFPTKSEKGFVYINDHLLNRDVTVFFSDTLYFHELQHALRLCGISKDIVKLKTDIL